MIPRPPISPLFPYTTLFRSLLVMGVFLERGRAGAVGGERPMTIEAKLLGRFTQLGIIARSMRIVDRKSTRLNSSHTVISYAVFCLKKKKKKTTKARTQ